MKQNIFNKFNEIAKPNILKSSPKAGINFVGIPELVNCHTEFLFQNAYNVVLTFDVYPGFSLTFVQKTLNQRPGKLLC